MIMVDTLKDLQGDSQPPRLRRGIDENDGAVSSAHTHIHALDKNRASSIANPVMSSFFCLSVFKALPVTWPGVHIVCVRVYALSFICASLYVGAAVVLWAQ